MTYENANRLFKGRQKVLNGFKRKIFSIKSTEGKGFKILIGKKKCFKDTKSSSTSKGRQYSGKLTKWIRQIIYSLYQVKEMTKKVYKNIMNSIKVQYKMETIFMNSRSSKTSDFHRLLLNLLEKINLKIDVIEVIDMLLHQILAYIIHGKILKSYIKIINLKYQLQRRMKDLNYFMGRILYQKLKTILSTSSKNIEKWLIVLQ